MTSNTLRIQAVYNFAKAFPEAQLTGSHFFGNATENSDVDFFVGYDPYVLARLLDYGFERSILEADAYEANAYLDSNTKEVLCLTVEGIKLIHVQLVHNVVRKTMAQNFLLSLPRPLLNGFLDCPRSARTKVWEWAFGMIDQLEGCGNIENYLTATQQPK